MLPRSMTDDWWLVEVSCLSSCTDDVLHSLAGPLMSLMSPNQNLSPHLTIYSYDLSNREPQTHGPPSPRPTRLLPSVFVKWLALHIRTLDERVLFCGREWSPQNEALIITNAYQHAFGVVVQSGRTNLTKLLIVVCVAVWANLHRTTGSAQHKGAGVA